jgi:hypothetical protein
VQSDHFFIIENFLKVIILIHLINEQGISGILRNQSIRMVKKKFYTIFNRMDSLQSYFDHLKSLFLLNVHLISLNGDEEDVKEPEVALGRGYDSPKDKNVQFFNEEDIVELGKRFLVIESLYVFIFYQLFFDIKIN